MKTRCIFIVLVCTLIAAPLAAQEWYQPYGPKQTEREDVFAFTEKPTVRFVGKDRYEIAFGAKGNCDVTVSLIDGKGVVDRHLASGVLGANAPAPFQKNSLKQKIHWNGKNDLGLYVKEPEKLKVRVQLGLKPAFDKLLGWHPKNLVGTYRAVAADKDGIYVLSGGNPQLRKYDRDGNYEKTVFPPAANVPVDRIKGLEKLEYEPGKWALHSYIGHGGAPAGLPYHAGFASTVSATGIYLPGGPVLPQQVELVDGLFTYATVMEKVENVWLYRIKASDGTSDDTSIAWRALARRAGDGLYTKDGKLITRGYFQSGEFAGSRVKMALSPDGKWLYLSGLTCGGGWAGVYRMDTKTRDPLDRTPWMGEDGKAGQDNQHFSSPAGIACDAQGRVYVCDTINNRIQVYSTDAKHLKTINVDRPDVIRIDRKTGALYVTHVAREHGQSFLALTKFKSFDSPTKVASFRIADSAPRTLDNLLTLDPWSSPLRLWVTRSPNHLVILEEQGNGFKVVRDFAKDAKDTNVPHQPMTDARFAKVSCDPVREKLYFSNYHLFDLATGKYEGRIGFPHATDDIVFDKRGRAHVHFNPGFYMPGVARLDPDQQAAKGSGASYREMPYDYGVQNTGRWNQEWIGILPVKDQPGAKFFQDGIAVNMQGDVAVQSNIYYVPKMEDSVAEVFVNQRRGTAGGDHSYQGFIRKVQEKEKRGERVYFIQRRPGRRLHGGTVWVYDATGELRRGNIVPGACLINGVGIDEDGAVYFAYASTRMVAGKAFLSGRGRVIGNDKPSNHPFTGTLVKFPRDGGELKSRQAPIKMDKYPDRPADTAGSGWGWQSTKENAWSQGKTGDWAEGAEWLYAGACPIVPLSCSCPNSRFYTDWFKRSFVTEAYRHSVGVVDTAGNLVMHVGTYGNADSGRGPDSPVKVDGGIAMAHTMYVAATDNYLCLSDMAGERVTVVKLGYHAEETVPIPGN